MFVTEQVPDESFFRKNLRKGDFFWFRRHLRARFRGANGSCQRQLVEMFPALTVRGGSGAGGASPASPLRGLVYWGRMVPGFRYAAPGATIRRPTGYEQGRRMCGSWCARACPGAADSRSARNNAVGQSPTARIGGWPSVSSTRWGSGMKPNLEKQTQFGTVW